MTTSHERLLTVEEILELNGGEIVATDISIDEYMEKYAPQHCEYFEGAVIRMSPGSRLHNRHVYFLYALIDIYFSMRPIGEILGQPFVMRLAEFPTRRREPDLLIVLDNNPGTLNETYMDGPADICIEVISKESSARDRGVKFTEYELGGVQEYWLLDSLRKGHEFYRRTDEGIYMPQSLNEQSEYTTPLLPDFRLHVPTLWTDPLPTTADAFARVQKMLKQKKNESN